MIINKRPKITDKEIELINKLIADNPDANRTKISAMLCEMWNWRMADGRIKNMSCQDMLRALDKAGKIKLPPPMHPGRKKGEILTTKHLIHDDTPITGNLGELMPLEVKVVKPGPGLTEFKSYIDQYHYLGFGRFVGENMAYMIYDRNGNTLACLLFGSAAWSCKDRDLHIGWTKEKRSQRLPLLTNNTRFLILPWVTVPHLASHMLSLVCRRISDDWQHKYGHPLILLETFVETKRFKGTCYKAANWLCVGRTTGRGRDGGHHHAVVPVKDIYVYPLRRNYMAILSD